MTQGLWKAALQRGEWRSAGEGCGGSYVWRGSVLQLPLLRAGKLDMTLSAVR
jgi:hypothetical protein